MSKVTKKDRIAHLEFQVTWLTNSMNELLGTEGLEFEPQLKQLDQSIFDGLDEQWRFATVDADGYVGVFDCEPAINCDEWYEGHGQQKWFFDNNYDTSNWQNSLIERDIAKEPTGSELCKAMLERGDRWILCGNTTDGFASPCIIDGYRCSEDDLGFVLTNGKSIEPRYIYPVNNKGEPLTAAEAGL